MKAFKERDPNGNGLADEIPLTGSKRHLEDLALWLMNAFVPAGGQDDSGDAFLNCYEFIVDGKVFFSADKDEFREGLRYIRKMYAEGFLDVDALTQDRVEIKPLIEGGVNRVGGVTAHHPGNFASLTDDLSKPFHDYAALPPIAGPKGQRNTPWFIDAVIRPGEFVITDRGRYPEAAFRWADHFYRLETMLNDKGVEGVHWSRVAAGEDLPALNGHAAKYRYLDPLKPEDNAQLNMGPGWTRDLKNEFAKSSEFSYEEFLYNATKLYEPFKVRRFPYATATIADGDFPEFNDLRQLIHTYVAEATDRFIIGDMDIDRQWDQYLTQLKRIGLYRYLQILQDSL
jgi:putative aldouronate transport system substrate-binding protein